MIKGFSSLIKQINDGVEIYICVYKLCIYVYIIHMCMYIHVFVCIHV